MKTMLLAMLGTLLVVSPVLAETWYLMAPDPKVFKDPMILHQMEQGMGYLVAPAPLGRIILLPCRLRGGAAQIRDGLARGPSDQHGMASGRHDSPDWFVTCSSPTDPHMTMSPAK